MPDSDTCTVHACLTFHPDRLFLYTIGESRESRPGEWPFWWARRPFDRRVPPDGISQRDKPVSMDDPQGSSDSAAQPVGQNPVHYVPVYDARESPSKIIGSIDVLRCEFLRETDLPECHGDAALCRTPRGVYFGLVIWPATLPHTENKVKRLVECAFFVSPRYAAAWFTADPEQAPEDLRPLVAQYDFTEAPTAPFFDPPATTAPEADSRTPEAPAERCELANAKCAPSIGKAFREKIMKFFRDNPKPEWKYLEDIKQGVRSKSDQTTRRHLRELVKEEAIEHQRGHGLWPGLTHHNSESGLAGKPCLLVKSKLLDHIFATFR